MNILGIRKAVIGFISFIFILYLPALGQKGIKEFTVEEIYGSGKFAGEAIRGIEWVKDKGKTTKFSFLKNDESTHQTNLWIHDLESGEQKLLVDASALVLNPGDRPFHISNYIWSPDYSKILFTGILPARKTKTGGDFYLYDCEKKSFRELTFDAREQSNVQFSPDGSRIGFVRANNISVLDLNSGKETQLTTDGAEHVLNGHFDWVYEEEFSIIDGWKWSPDGKRIAYWHLDENRVPVHLLWNYEPQHAESIETRYPQPGDPNSIVKIGIISLDTKKNAWVDLGANDDIYVPRIYWSPAGNSLFVERLNRAQNLLEMLAADPVSGSTKVLFMEKDDAWIDIFDDMTFLPSTNQFIWSSKRDGYKHLYLYNMDGRLIQQITKGDWEVDRLKGIDEKQGLIYFTAAKKSPLERHLYAIRFDGSGLRQLTKGDGTHSIDMSPDHQYFIDSYSTVIRPQKQLLYSSGGTLIRELEDNPMNILNEYSMGEAGFFTFKTSDGVELYYSMITPPAFDSNKKYPVLLDVYGEPGSQTVKNTWGGKDYLWQQMLAQKGFVIVQVDNRGTGFRGKAFEQMGYLHLGKWEVNDYIETAKYLGSLPNVDKNRIGIWGWSYGGYVTLLTMCLGADYFKTGVAVAPVTQWMYYDDIYTERYMSTPKENPEGYNESSPINYASQMKGNLLIIHGTDDDNVHWQNTITMVDTLIKADKQFETAFYPGKNHNISGGMTRLHLYTKITEFILKNL